MQEASRSVDLGADLHAPARGRAVVTEVLAEAGLGELLDVGLLLTSELVSNAVLHAGTAVHLDVAVEGTTLSVVVTDGHPGPLGPRQAVDDLHEGGRGLALVEALADTWGTTHTRTGKSVWFRCSTHPLPAAGAPPQVEPRTGVSWSAPVRPPLLLPDEGMTALLGPAEELRELLLRITEHLDAVSGSADVDGGGEPVTVTRRPTRAPRHEAVLPLGHRRAPLGRLTVVVDRSWTLDDEAALRFAAAALTLAVRRRQLEQRLADQARRLTFIAEASDLLSGSLSVGHTAALLVQLAVPVLGDWAAAYTVSSDGALSLAAVHGRDERQAEGLRERLADPPPVPEQTQVGPAPDEVLRLPLRARQRLLGLLAVGRDSGRAFTAADTLLVEDLARRAALTLDNARLYQDQVDVVEALQQALLPPRLPQIGGLELAGEYVGVREGLQVGGDFYDVVPVGERSWALVIGDVCGKGAEAAAATGMVRSVLRLLLREGRSISQALCGLNGAIVERGDEARFCTALLVLVEQRAERTVLRLCSAGHPPPLLLPVSGEPRFLGTEGALLGVLPSEALGLVELEVPLEPGDALVLYTDGVTERRDGSRMLGEFGLRAIGRDAAGGTAGALAARIRQRAVSFSPEPARDDIAVLVLRRTP